MSLLRRSRLLINPAYADLLRRAGLREPQQFLQLHEEIISGHTDRQVSRVQIGAGPGAITAYLKREHRVPLIARLRNLWAGFGFSSKSWREAQLLRELTPRFAGCPAWIAAGELSDGQAFVLLREVAGAVPLTRLLREDVRGRRRLARALGESLARLHAAGYIHGDLYANHVLIVPGSLQIVFLDWQRAAPGRTIWRDLAALQVTLPAGLVSRGDFLACLQWYCGKDSSSVREAVGEIERETRQLRRRRHIRVKKRAAEAPALSLLCLDGEALRVTPAFRRLWPGEPPSFLRGSQDQTREVELPDGGRGLLVRRRHRLPRSQQSGAARRTWTSPERLQMNLLNRLERVGIEAPRVLATGEVALSEDTVSAFLLTTKPAAIPLAESLARVYGEERVGLLRSAGRFLSCIHQAGCYFERTLTGLGVAEDVVLMNAAELRVRRRLRVWWRTRDLRRLCRLAGNAAERASLLQSYWNVSTLKEADG